jgi:hypothetical protein
MGTGIRGVGPGLAALHSWTRSALHALSWFNLPVLGGFSRPLELRFRIGPLVVGCRLTSEPLARSFTEAWQPFVSIDRAHIWIEVEVRPEGEDPNAPKLNGARVLPSIHHGRRGVRLIEGEEFQAQISRDLRNARIRQTGTGRFPVESVIKIVLADRLARSGGLLLHAAAVASGGRAAVFTGPSGAGKSTLALFCRKGGMELLADELTAIAPVEEGFVVHGTPWNQGEPHSATLRILGTLQHAPNPELEVAAGGSLVRVLLTNTLLADPSPEGRADIFRAAGQLIERTRCGVLSFAKDERVAEVLRRELQVNEP